MGFWEDLEDDAHSDAHSGPLCRCGSNEVEERFSLGITAGYWCSPCWATSGYRKEGREGFDPDYAGETYEEEGY